MTVCVPVRDLKDTAKFASLVERERDVAVTKNGYSAFHCLSEDEYRLMQDEVAKAKLLSRILRAEQEIENHDYTNYTEFVASIRDQYGL